MVKIFITGCAKSGTTMLLDMFRAFAKTWVIRDEITLTNFVNLKKEQIGDFDFVIGKRTDGTVFSASDLTERDINRQLYLIARNDIKIVNIVRDGRNVVKSYLESWGYYNPFEWMECVLQAKKFKDFLDIEVKYEELLIKPDDVQAQIADKFEMTEYAKFSDYPDFIPNDNRSTSDKSYNLRPLDVEKLKVDKETYLRRPNDVEYFNKLLTDLNYNL